MLGVVEEVDVADGACGDDLGDFTLDELAGDWGGGLLCDGYAGVGAD